MSRLGRLACATALALGVIFLAHPSWADGDTTPTSSDKPGLPLRPSKQLAMAPESSGTTGLWKLVLFVAVAGGGVWLYKRRARAAAGAPSMPKVRIVSRTQVALRSELVVVEVDGATMLLGVTPHAIQLVTTLADATAELPRTAPEPASIASVAQERVRSAPARFERQIAGLLRARSGG